MSVNNSLWWGMGALVPEHYSIESKEKLFGSQPDFSETWRFVGLGPKTL